MKKIISALRNLFIEKSFSEKRIRYEYKVCIFSGNSHSEMLVFTGGEWELDTAKDMYCIFKREIL